MRIETPYRFAAGIALIAAFMLVWLSMGVGIIGRDGDPANRMYLGVLVIGALGSLAARLRPHGMARTLFAMAVAQAVIGLYAIAAGLGRPYSGPLELSLLHGLFVALFSLSAWFFGQAERRPASLR